MPIEKQMMGKELYYHIEKIEQNLTGKVTGMILELDNDEIKMLLKSKDKLHQKVSEALRVLEEHQKSLECGFSDEISLSEISSSSEGCKNEDCVICMEPLGKKNVCVTECGHSFCTSCIIRAAQINTDCPLCRTELAPKPELIRSGDLDTAYEAGWDTGFDEAEEFYENKMDILRECLDKNENEINGLKEENNTLKKELLSIKKIAFRNGYKRAFEVLEEKKRKEAELPTFNIKSDTEFPTLS